MGSVLQKSTVEENSFIGYDTVTIGGKNILAKMWVVKNAAATTQATLASEYTLEIGIWDEAYGALSY